MIEQTQHLLTQMRLFGMLESMELRLHEAIQHGWGHQELLEALVMDEKTYRDNKQTQRRLKAAKFRTDACQEKIDTTGKR
jgi:DNA replication protein DnaC